MHPVCNSFMIAIAAPNQTLGFYRVGTKLSNDVTLAALGTRDPGFLTYAVVPDPATRVDVGEMDSRFGVQGGFSTKANVIPYLGIRWVLGGYGWKDMEPDHSGQFTDNRNAALAKGQQYPSHEAATESVTYNGQPWTVYTLPTLYHSSPSWATIPSTQGLIMGALTVPDGENAWSNYVKAAGLAYAANYPNRQQHIYQITWEPKYTGNYQGTDEQLVRIYQIAYQALHQADPKAVVIGPTSFLDANGGLAFKTWLKNVLNLGLGKYLDGFSVHPYVFQYPPEPAGMVSAIREQKSLVNNSAGKNLPEFGTEHGYTVSDTLTELDQARGNVRQSLILLGEGYQFDFVFYIADFPDKKYGFYYNLNPNVAFGTDKVSPRPVVPAFASETFLLDGYHAVGAIETLGGTSWGYAFERNGVDILALWDYGTTRNVTLNFGVPQVELYDWMGNHQTLQTSNGMGTVTLGPEPIYIKGVSPQIWGTSPTLVTSQ